MTQKSAPEEQWLGEVNTSIAGNQYCDADAEPGETLTTEREPGNPHDPNAIRLENETFEKIGYLPRRVASWLAPLVDEGLVVADAVAGQSKIDDDLPTVILKLFISHNGAGILEIQENPPTESRAIHRIVTETYLSAGNWTRPTVIRATGHRLDSLHKKELLPETRMLLSLFPYQADNVRRRQTDAALATARDFVRHLEVGDVVSYDNLALFPVYGPPGDAFACDPVKAGLESGHVLITEVSDTGVVSELRVQNNSTRPILIPEGEILTGAKQDRVVNVTVLVAASSVFTLPVTCVEQGRWDLEAEGFQATHYAPHGLRASKNEGVSADRAAGGIGHSDQSQVWGDIAETMREMNLSSDTDSLPESYQQAEKFLVGYRENISLPPDCNGVILIVNNEIAGMDYFDDAHAFARMWPALSQAYYFEAARLKRSGATTNALEQAQSYLSELTEILSVSERPLGDGVELYLSGGSMTGSGILIEDRIAHLTASTSSR